MSSQVSFVKGVPGLNADARYDYMPPDFLSRGRSGYLRSEEFIAKFDLISHTLNWVVERSMKDVHRQRQTLPVQIEEFDASLWVDHNDLVVVEMVPLPCGGINIVARETQAGNTLWERLIPLPAESGWSAPRPAFFTDIDWQISAFFGQDSQSLVVLMFDCVRRARVSSSTQGIEVQQQPKYLCQTDGIRLNPLTGDVAWEQCFTDVRVGIMERPAFTGLWVNQPLVGVIDFVSGTNTILHESEQQLGTPIRDGSGLFAVPWHSRTQVGIDRFDKSGHQVRQTAWPQSKVKQTVLWNTGAGLGLQTNDQTLAWLGTDTQPLWNIRAKPYIYQVHATATSPIFVATDGNGGRLFAFDREKGTETLNLKPALGGVGGLSRVPLHDVLVAAFRVSKSYAVPSKLLVLSMNDQSCELEIDCDIMLGTWDHGAVCLAGKHGERLAVVELNHTSES